MSLSKQSLFLVLGFAVVFIINVFALTSLTIPLSGIFVVAYLLLSRFGGKNKSLLGMDEYSIVLLTTIILLLIFSTGGLESYVFFLLYFLCFALAFALLPETVFIFLAGVIIIFLPQIGQNTTESIIKLGSFALITPLAYFFGKEYRVVQIHHQRDEEIAKRISTEAANVLRDQEERLPEADKEQLADIIEESQELRK